MDDDNRIVFAQEVECHHKDNHLARRPWKILVADDEPEIHEITRIALGSYSFEGRGVKLLSAYSGLDVREILSREEDVALILLDVVMEKDDTGLQLVHYIRKELGNIFSRIVLRTGQAGKAPEQEVITRYDINDYKSKTELTAQKLFTSVTASLRAYSSLKMIERNRKGLENIIRSTATIFESLSFSQFAQRALTQLLDILKEDSETFKVQNSVYAAAQYQGSMRILSGMGRYAGMENVPVRKAFPATLIKHYEQLNRTGGDLFIDDEYMGLFQTKDGSRSLLYLDGCSSLATSDKNLIRVFTTNAFIGFENLSLAREIIDTQKEVIFTLGEIVETRSKETAHHVTRVAEVCYLLAIHYGMHESTAERLKLASPMHDIGKIGIPESILHKPGALTPEEFNVIKTHADTGYYILKNSKRQIMQTAAIVAWQHHEKWDGTGYPQGLAGEDIHIYGRIAAIADVFDALTHRRCYKDAWSMEKVVDLFKDESGRHFDPDLVEILLLNIDMFVTINRKFPEE
ncbi:MAG: HD domain-containing phosphohydrolase [Pseudomonadota bacterium]